MTIETRAVTAAVALTEFVKLWPWSDDEVIGDLICNLLHLAEKRGENPSDVIARAQKQFAESRIAERV